MYFLFFSKKLNKNERESKIKKMKKEIKIILNSINDF